MNLLQSPLGEVVTVDLISEGQEKTVFIMEAGQAETFDPTPKIKSLHVISGKVEINGENFDPKSPRACTVPKDTKMQMRAIDTSVVVASYFPLPEHDKR